MTTHARVPLHLLEQSYQSVEESVKGGEVVLGPVKTKQEVRKETVEPFALQDHLTLSALLQHLTSDIHCHLGTIQPEKETSLFFVIRTTATILSNAKK